MNIENEHLFNNALSTGINLFVGAGFSILAKDEDGNRLPLGSELSKELAAIFWNSSPVILEFPNSSIKACAIDPLSAADMISNGSSSSGSGIPRM